MNQSICECVFYFYLRYLPVIAGEIAFITLLIVPTSPILGNFFDIRSFVVGMMIICKVPCAGSEKPTSVVA